MEKNVRDFGKSFLQATRIVSWLMDGKSICHMSRSKDDLVLRNVKDMFGKNYSHKITEKVSEVTGETFYLHDLKPAHNIKLKNPIS